MKQEQILQDIREGYGTIAQCLVSMAEGKAKSRDILKACERIESSRRQLANIVGQGEATRIAKEQLAFIF